MFRSVGYLVDVAVWGTEVRPRLARGFPLVYGTDELDALRLDNIDQQPDDQWRVAYEFSPSFVARGFSWSHASMRV
jgi:hypothetical protein